LEIDGRTVADDTRLLADICIVGGGPAGLSLASALAGRDRTVLLLESGGSEPDAALQALNDGTIVGDAYAGLRATRHRGLGGGVRLWNTPVVGEPGGKYTPLDAADLHERATGGLGGWPFDYTHLEPLYRRAQRACGLGPFAYGAEQWTGGAVRPLDLAGDRVTTRVYQFGTAREFTGRNLARLREADNITVCTHATVRGLDVEGSRVGRIDVVDSSGRPLRVAAQTCVLAAGAVENARLLLLSLDPEMPAARHGWIGRCFMEHPRDFAMTLHPHSPALFHDAAFYDARRTATGTIVGGRLALTERALWDDALPNAAVTLLPRRKPSSRLARFRERLSRPSGPQQGGYGWSGLDDPVPAFDAFRMIVNLEQRPHPDNRVVLTSDRDRLGVPRVALHWRWRPDEQAGVERLRAVVVRAIEDAAIGRVEVAAGHRIDPNAHHHAGTTRMSDDPRRGVVDADGRVHGIENLYITGASVFPTAGFANPTLTIVALALKLADRIAAT
jgi:choline dehydrogenase-like flavoprotein